MMRLNWVPLHSIFVVRDGKQVDAYAEYLKTGKAFAFTEDEIKEITDVNGGQGELSLRSPTEEAAANEAAPAEPLASNETPKTKAVKAKDADL